MVTISIKEIEKSENVSLHLRVSSNTKHNFELAAKKLGYKTTGALLDAITPQLYEQAFKEKK